MVIWSFVDIRIRMEEEFGVRKIVGSQVLEEDLPITAGG